MDSKHHIDKVDGCGGMRGPIGLGYRVPCFVISPHSRGETFDFPYRPTRHGRTWTTGPPTAVPRRSVHNAVLGFLSDGPLLGALPAAGAGEESGTIRAPAPASRRRSLPKHPTVDRVHADRETRSASWLRLSWVPWRDCGAAAGNKIDRFGYIFPRIALAC